MSDTPRTDSQLGSLTNAPDDTCCWIEIRLPREIERELTAANLALNAERAESAKQMLVIDGLTQNFESEKERAEMLKEQRDYARDQRDKLIAAIETHKRDCYPFTGEAVDLKLWNIAVEMKGLKQ
jgi:hypothetical protein